MKFAKYLILSVALALVACATVDPNSPSGGASIPIDNLKIKKLAPVSYKYESVNIGCSEIEFLKKYTGKIMKLEDGSSIFIENIFEIHIEKYYKKVGSNKNYTCSFWGLAAEYAK